MDNPDFKKIKKKFDISKGEVDNGVYFIWGIKARDDFTDSEPNLFTLNDIDLIYDSNDGNFKLSIETAYHFEDIKHRNHYLLHLLNSLEEFMKDNGFPTNEIYFFDFSNCKINLESNFISQVFAQFRVFVKGLLYEEIEV
jgi:hypothetical protein